MEGNESAKPNTGSALSPLLPTNLPVWRENAEGQWGKGKLHQEENQEVLHLFSDSLPSKPVPSFFILSCHVGLSSQIESCFPNWPMKRFCHAEIIPRAKSGNLRQPGNLTAGQNAACNKRHCE